MSQIVETPVLHTQLREKALDCLQVQDWNKAAPLWRELYHLGALTCTEDFHACARAFEAVQDWVLHEQVLAEAMLLFPGDSELASRGSYRKAMQLYADARWKEAFEHLQHLEKKKPSSWTFPLGYYRWQAFILCNLDGNLSSEERLNKVVRLAFFKHPALFSRQIAGLDLIVRCFGWSKALEERFSQRLDRLISVLAQTDNNLSDVTGVTSAWSILPVQEMAELFRADIKLLRDLPGPYVSFLARLFLQHGFYDLYRLFRIDFVNKFSEIAGLPFRKASLPSFLFAVAFHSENGDEAGLRALGDELSERPMDEQRVGKKSIALSELYFPKRGQSNYLAMQEETGFAEFIRGKSVAIVGPVDVGLDNGCEIESFDLVIRFNPRSAVVLASERFGQRTDIGYYSTINIATGESGYLKAMNSLLWVVVEDRKRADLEWLSKVFVPVREHIRGWSYDVPFLFGTPNAVQRVLLDILRFQPSRVKIFNTNFYLTSNFSGGYRDCQMNMFPGLAIHDPVSNFLFTRKCLHNWNVEADAVASEVLSLELDDYLDRLGRQYARFSR